MELTIKAKDLSPLKAGYAVRIRKGEHTLYGISDGDGGMKLKHIVNNVDTKIEVSYDYSVGDDVDIISEVCISGAEMTRIDGFPYPAPTKHK